MTVKSKFLMQDNWKTSISWDNEFARDLNKQLSDEMRYLFKQNPKAINEGPYRRFQNSKAQHMYFIGPMLDYLK